jgi:hypothetical protein
VDAEILDLRYASPSFPFGADTRANTARPHCLAESQSQCVGLGTGSPGLPQRAQATEACLFRRPDANGVRSLDRRPVYELAGESGRCISEGVHAIVDDLDHKVEEPVSIHVLQ